MKNEDIKRPKWVPDNSSEDFTTSVMAGINSSHDGFSTTISKKPRLVKKRIKLTLEDYEQGVREGNRTILARAITLVESNSHKHRDMAEELIKKILPFSGHSVRIGITGMPGAGKSTFIEAIGNYLCDRGHKVAVLAVDPSSSLTKGSILGDKTRMERLATRKEAFIRPSPSGGVLGGVARKSRETMILCEAAGYDVILVETVGVGQSEITVRSMVDFFLLVTITGAGDELQGMKKGVMELADSVLINKADGENRTKAEVTKGEFNRILHYLQPSTPEWITQAYTASSIEGNGIGDIWEVICQFREKTTETGFFMKRRHSQEIDWMKAMIDEYLRKRFYENEAVKEDFDTVQQLILDGNLTPALGAQRLIGHIEG
ncbi:MAG TPA: methylmalonyl Co-A mutase-associated GTPase MeaB [Thermotogota bacterium]|nr:methylmalonyl Co-A mutase-associated GTPase MeaB [Thermotogota bacterium]HPJ89645.1 methylmalonyl Co-A mutase-associated GTPase MeaB [Thermotogota bacterium]HPR96804.1 methylmalonyl Co-A mutase-associated GTPase MeaB [Thermotogota bacterium]